MPRAALGLLEKRKVSSPTSGAKRLKLGAHMSVAGGFQNAFLAGAAAGCNCLQIFVKNQRQWNAPKLRHEQVVDYVEAARQSSLSPVVAHASYLLNLASPTAATRRRSVSALVDELRRCEALGVESLVLHPGSHLDSSLAAGVKNIAKSLNAVHNRSSGFRTRILLETTAGQGTSIGHRFEHLRDILGLVKAPGRVGVCLDTCHLFAAGYDFRSPTGYKAVMDDLERTIQLRNVHCIHVNDSKRPLGSRVDRHEHIGKGEIGARGFAHFVNDTRLIGVPMILETPKGKDDRGRDFDRMNLQRLRRLAR